MDLSALIAAFDVPSLPAAVLLVAGVFAAIELVIFAAHAISSQIRDERFKYWKSTDIPNGKYVNQVGRLRDKEEKYRGFYSRYGNMNPWGEYEKVRAQKRAAYYAKRRAAKRSDDDDDD